MDFISYSKGRHDCSVNNITVCNDSEYMNGHMNGLCGFRFNWKVILDTLLRIAIEPEVYTYAIRQRHTLRP